ncbi:MAG TPA: BBE domain-containing protein [Candidatus Dormibacteraeota bacterium]|nr:BBE domain-containing protein [Candidatus Dormibacteraeota bacterium]
MSIRPGRPAQLPSDPNLLPNYAHGDPSLTPEGGWHTFLRQARAEIRNYRRVSQANAVRWVRALRDNLQPFTHGVYVNALGETSDELVRKAYGPNYAWLVEIKKKYDPTNALRLNQNVKPGQHLNN